MFLQMIKRQKPPGVFSWGPNKAASLETFFTDTGWLQKVVILFVTSALSSFHIGLGGSGVGGALSKQFPLPSLNWLTLLKQAAVACLSNKNQ